MVDSKLKQNLRRVLLTCAASTPPTGSFFLTEVVGPGWDDDKDICYNVNLRIPNLRTSGYLAALASAEVIITHMPL